jgi:hypothetical protein
MAFCKPTYTVIRSGIVIANSTTADSAMAAVTADNAKFCPTPCNVGFESIDFDGRDWTITLTPETSAPYLFFISNEADGENIFAPTPDFPLLIPNATLFPQSSSPTGITIIGATANVLSIDVICSIAEVGMPTLSPATFDGNEDFLLSTSLSNCTGALTYSVLYTTADSATIVSNTITIVADEASITYVLINCDGLPAAIRIYDLPEPV